MVSQNLHLISQYCFSKGENLFHAIGGDVYRARVIVRMTRWIAVGVEEVCEPFVSVSPARSYVLFASLAGQRIQTSCLVCSVGEVQSGVERRGRISTAGLWTWLESLRCLHVEVMESLMDCLRDDEVDVEARFLPFTGFSSSLPSSGTTKSSMSCMRLSVKYESSLYPIVASTLVESH